MYVRIMRMLSQRLAYYEKSIKTAEKYGIPNIKELIKAHRELCSIYDKIQAILHDGDWRKLSTFKPIDSRQYVVTQVRNRAQHPGETLGVRRTSYIYYDGTAWLDMSDRLLGWDIIAWLPEQEPYKN